MRETEKMRAIRWELYPRVADSELPHQWLQIQAHLQLTPKTIDAYGRCLEDYLSFCSRHSLAPQLATREHIALYIHDLATRSNPRGPNILSIQSGRGLSNATMQQRITVVRLFYDYLVEQQLRSDHPVGRGHYVQGKGFGGTRDKGLLPHYQKLPWIPLRNYQRKGSRSSSRLVSVYSKLCHRRSLHSS